MRGVTRLRLVTDENGGNGNDHTDWADAKLLGATRDISKADTSYTTTVASSSQGLQPGTDFKAYVTMKNTGSGNPYAASLALYDSEGNLVDVSILEDRISQKGNESITLEIPVPADAGLGYEARLNIYDPETLELMATTAHFGMQMEPSASTQRVLRAAYAAAPASAQDGDAYVTVDGESASVVKEGAWGLWNDSGAYEGTETFVGDSYDWEGASLSLTFTGTQVIVGGKIDGSQKGADVYLDGELVDHINSNSSANDGKNGYYEVWRSEALENSIDGLVEKSTSTSSKNSGSTSANVGNAYGAAGVVSASQSVSAQAYVVSDTTVNFTLKRGSAYCFKMTVVNGNNMVPSFTVGNGDVLKTQFVAKVGNDYYYRVYAIGAPGQNTGVYTTLPGQNATKHCTVTIG